MGIFSFFKRRGLRRIGAQACAVGVVDDLYALAAGREVAGYCNIGILISEDKLLIKTASVGEGQYEDVFEGLARACAHVAEVCRENGVDVSEFEEKLMAAVRGNGN